MSGERTPGPWRWQGEDYRAGWGWQLLVGANGEGVMCGSRDGAPYEHLRAYQPILPGLCRTGFEATGMSAPGVHVREPDARLIVAAPELLDALEHMLNVCPPIDPSGEEATARARAIVARVRGK